MKRPSRQGTKSLSLSSQPRVDTYTAMTAGLQHPTERKMSVLVFLQTPFQRFLFFTFCDGRIPNLFTTLFKNLDMRIYFYTPTSST